MAPIDSNMDEMPDNVIAFGQPRGINSMGGDPAAEAGSDGYITAPSWKGPYTVRVATTRSPASWSTTLLLCLSNSLARVAVGATQMHTMVGNPKASQNPSPAVEGALGCSHCYVSKHRV